MQERALIPATLVVLLPFAVSCGATALAGVGGGVAAGGSLPNMNMDCHGDFGASVAAGTLETFLRSTDLFVEASNDLAGSLTLSCKTMGNELEIAAREMEPQNGEAAARAACDPVTAFIRAEIADLRAAHLTIELVAQPPRCEASIDAAANCAAECDARYEPGHVDVQCEGGEIRGRCGGECRGRCATGASEEQVEGSCAGECRGSCSVAFTEPRCTGAARPPQMSAECNASCDARLQATATCEPGGVELRVGGADVPRRLRARVARLERAIEASFGQILAIRTKLERVGTSADGIARVAAELPGSIRDLGAGAAACVSGAAGALPNATASVNVSVEVSASVVGSVG